MNYSLLKGCLWLYCKGTWAGKELDIFNYRKLISHPSLIAVVEQPGNKKIQNFFHKSAFSP